MKTKARDYHGFDFALSGDKADVFEAYPLSSRALELIEKARGLHWPAAFQWYAVTTDELVAWYGRGFHFC